MTNDELQRFLDKVGSPSLEEYLGVRSGVGAMDALDERLRWAAWHFRDPDHREESEFVLTHAVELRRILDEGEELWRARESKKPSAPSWQAIHAFQTPMAASRREPDDATTPRRPPPREEPIELDLDALEPFDEEEEDEDEDDAEEATDPVAFEAAPLASAAPRVSYTPPGPIQRPPPDPADATGPLPSLAAQADEVPVQDESAEAPEETPTVPLKRGPAVPLTLALAGLLLAVGGITLAVLLLLLGG